MDKDRVKGVLTFLALVKKAAEVVQEDVVDPYSQAMSQLNSERERLNEESKRLKAQTVGLKNEQLAKKNEELAKKNEALAKNIYVPEQRGVENKLQVNNKPLPGMELSLPSLGSGANKLASILAHMSAGGQ